MSLIQFEFNSSSIRIDVTSLLDSINVYNLPKKIVIRIEKARFKNNLTDWIESFEVRETVLED